MTVTRGSASERTSPEAIDPPEPNDAGASPSPRAAADARDAGDAEAAGEWLPVAPVPGGAAGEPAGDAGDAQATERQRPVVAGEAPGPEAPASADAPPVVADLRDATAELLALDPDHFVLQLLVNSSASRARDWIAARDRPDQYRWFRRERDGVPQYVVVRGAWESRAEASRVADAVAARTGIDAPWIRRAADIQAEIRSP
ncbi:MAG: hypothetical protein U5R48_10825 [Gammaproteobacteria bacterium]|nr:hypothetical protein [Gammaproteobacteria bacterium]